MSKILITGGAGFIGSALARYLQNDYEVHLIDRKKNFSAKPDLYKFPQYEINISASTDFEKIADKQFDFIFHLAAQTSGRVSQESPDLDVDTNVKGTLNVCNYARKCNAHKIIFISSMAVYGQQEGEIKETNILSPLSNYGASKASGEIFIKMFEQFGIKNTIFRPFNVYGPGQDMNNRKQGMASIFMAQSILGNEIKVTGSLDRYRDFIFIDDVVQAIALGLIKESDGETYNIGSGIKTTVRELINLILDVNVEPATSFTVTEETSHEGDQFGSVADASKLRSLGWKCNMELKTGLEETYNRVKHFNVPSFFSCTR